MTYWFLVLLFWNPVIQSYDVADGWYPMPYATETICEIKLDFVKMYLPQYTPDMEHVVECVEATGMNDAIEKVQGGLND